MTKIIIHGIGGQGVKLLGKTLAYIMSELGKEVTLTYEYDSNVRGGSVTAYLTYSKEKIMNPIIDEADYLITLTTNTKFKGKKIIVEESTHEGEEETIIKVPLSALAENLGNKKLINMVTLGFILRELNINLKNLNFKQLLPNKLYDDNLKAIEQGYDYVERSEL